MRSFNYDQFQGQNVDSAPDCWPSITNADMNQNFSIGGNQLDQGIVAFPCGLIAKTFFNGFFLGGGEGGNFIVFLGHRYIFSVPK